VYVASRLVVDSGTVFTPGRSGRSGRERAAGGSEGGRPPGRSGGLPQGGVPREAILPGLVNAHTHLQIPRFADDAGTPLPIPASFVDWILRVIAWKRGRPRGPSPEISGRPWRVALLRDHYGREIAGPDLSAYDGCPLRARVFAEGIGFAPHVAARSSTS